MPRKLIVSLVALTLFLVCISTQLTSGQIAALGSCTPPPPGMVAWWPGEGNGDDIRGGNTATLNSITFVSGEVGQAFKFGGAQTSNINVPASPGIDIGNASGTGSTIEMWINPASADIGSSGHALAEYNDGSGGVGAHFYLNINGSIQNAPGALYANLVDTSNAGHVIGTAGAVIVADSWQHVAVTYNKVNGNASLYVNGAVVAGPTNLGTNLTLQTTYPLDFGIRRSGPATAPYSGAEDEIELFNRALSQTEVQNIFNAGSAGKCRPCMTPPPGMIAWWPAEGNANDIRGENNGTLMPPVNGATFSAGKVGQAFSFDGVDDFVKLPDNFLPYPTGGTSNAPLSFEAWFKTNAGGVIFGQQDADPFNPIGGGIPAVYVGTDGKLYAQMFWKGAVDPIVSAGTVNDGTFHHVAVTYDGTNERVYLDGGLVGTKPFTQQSYAAVYKYQFGTGNTGTTWPAAPTGTGGWFSFNGLLDEPTLYTRALSQSEIQSIITAASAGKCKPRCTPPPNNLVSWWTGDDNPFDIFGTNHGAMPAAGAGFGAGKVGRAFTFNGSQNPVSVPDHATLNPQTLTVDAWVFPTALDGSEDIILNKEVVGTVQYEMGIRGNINAGGTIPFGNLTVYVGGITGLPDDHGGWVNGGGPLPLNKWSHVAMTYDGSTLNAFINGVLTRQVTGLSGAVASSNGPFRIGTRAPGVAFATDPFNGSIDEVEIFNRALSPSEIQAISNAGFAGKCKLCLAPPANMVGWWNGDANASDTSGSGNNGTLQGGAAFVVGKVGQSFNFDGVDDFVSIANNASLDIGTGDLTIDLWVNFNSLAQDQELFHKVSGTGASVNDPSYFVEFDQPNALRFRIGQDLSAANDLIIPTSLVTGVWYHIAAVRSGNTNTLYLNGSSLGSQTAGNNIDTGTGGNAAIGKCLSSGSCVRFVNGRLDELEVFNRALTQTEIQSMVAASTSGKCKRGTTSTGAGSSNQLGDATITFGNVSNGGTTTYQTLETYQAGPMPFGFNNPLHVADISSAATFTGGAQVCFNLQASEFAGPFTQLRVLHLENNELVNRTISASPTTKILCASVTSLSPFVIAQNPSLPTAAPATISGRVTTADGAPLAGATVRLDGARSTRTITDSNGNYHFDNVDTDKFYTVTPSRVNYHFSPEEHSFSLLGNKTDAVFTALPDSVLVGNAIDTADYFVRQHYLDFLGREPDESGFNFWSDQILACGNDAGCAERRRINVSAAYFLSIEFQQTGGFVDGLYRVSYGRAPRYAEFMPDRQNVARDVVVGRSDWAGQLEANKRAFIDAWIQREEFRAAYDRLSNSALVEALLSHSPGFTGNRDALVTGLDSGSLTRAAALRQVVENEGFTRAKFNEMFVLMEYFGYLRRDPDASGYQFWLNKLNQFGGNFEQAEMVKAFIVSGEYRGRFPR